MNVYLPIGEPASSPTTPDGEPKEFQAITNPGLDKLSRSPTVSYVVIASLGLVIVAGTVNPRKVKVFSFVMAFIKLFQIIEILGKLIFVPVHYSGVLLEVLLAVYHIGDPIDISSELLTPGKYQDSIAGYMGKITFYEEYGNLLQAMPLVVGLFLLITLIKLIVGLVRNTTSGSIEKTKGLLKRLSLLFLEVKLVDVSFYIVLNIFVFHKFSKYGIARILSFLASSVVLALLSNEYVQIAFRIYKNKPLDPVSKEFIEEGLDPRSMGLIP
jgi:hypothetical protein